MKTVIVFCLSCVLCCACCMSHNDLVLKYGKLYTRDIELAQTFYERKDSLINVSNSTRKEKEERRRENLKVLTTNLDLAEFRFNYYTTKGLKEIVDKSINDWNCYVYVGKFHTCKIYEKPTKKGLMFTVVPYSILDVCNCPLCLSK